MLNEIAAAKVLGVKTGTIRGWRVRGTGPAYHKMPGLRGAVRYDIRDLEEFKRQCRHTPSVRAFVREEMSGRL